MQDEHANCKHFMYFTGDDNDYSINNYCEVVRFLVSHGF